MTPHRYCFTLGAAALAIAGTIAAFNYTVDPYLLFDVKRVPGFNDLKPSSATREWMMKAYQSERISAHTIVIGSSRPDLGIDPAAHAWPTASRPVYNMSIIGGSVDSGVKYLRHYVAMRHGHGPATVLVGLDFEDNLYFSAPAIKPSGPPRLSENDERLNIGTDGQPNPAQRMRVIKDRMQGLLSLDALIDSVHTIMGNRSATVANLEANGHLSEIAMADTAHSDGFGLLFDQKNLETVHRFAGPHKPLSDTPDGLIHGVDTLQELLTFAKQHGIEVILTIQPSHVSRLELLDRMGYSDEYDRWKRALTALVAQAATSQKVVLWDFNGYEQPMQEAVPAKGQGNMQWFWDPVHYNSRLGARIIARIYGTGQLDDIGVMLTPQNIDARIAKVRHDRDAFRAAMPKEAARLARLACGNAPCPAVSTTLAAAH